MKKVGFDLPNDEPLMTLKQVNVKWPRTTSIALVDNTRDFKEAKATGADIVLMKGVW
jgi:hypothetical protein